MIYPPFHKLLCPRNNHSLLPVHTCRVVADHVLVEAEDAVGDVGDAAAHHLRMPLVQPVDHSSQVRLSSHTTEGWQTLPQLLSNNKPVVTQISPTSIRSITIGMHVSDVVLTLKMGTHLSRAPSSGGTIKIPSPERMRSNSLRRDMTRARRGCKRWYYQQAATPDG